MVRLIDRPDKTLDIYRECKTTTTTMSECSPLEVNSEFIQLVAYNNLPPYISLRPKSLTSFASLAAVSITGSIKMASLESGSARRYVYVNDLYSNSCKTQISNI